MAVNEDEARIKWWKAVHQAREKERESAVTVFCESCTNCEQPSKGAAWYRWHCLRAPKPAQEQFVARDRWLTESPHMLCKNINPEGTCEMFERKKDGVE